MLLARNANAQKTETGWLLRLPEGALPRYRYAQIDDYTPLPRRRFLWRAGSVLRLRARVSAPDLPGTWGFGFWNDPFSFALGLGGMGRRLPVLPNCAWFFYASPENHLSFRDDLPGSGLLAQTFCAPRIPSAFLALGLPGLPLLLLKPLSRWLRTHAAANLIREDSQRLQVDVTQWHIYRLEWDEQRVAFFVDDDLAFETNISPQGPLGLVLWIDNQFAAWRPDGTLTVGVLPNPSAWLEMAEISAVSRGAVAN